MKKTLLMGTALATAALIAASPASAELTVSAFMEWGIGFGSTDQPGGGSSRLGYGTNTNSEVHFMNSTTTDAGLDLGWAVEFEADVNGQGVIDESSMFISGAFGKVTLGSNDAAMDPHIDGAVNGVPGMTGDEDYAPNHKSGATKVENGLTTSSDNLMMRYDTPTLNGTKASISFTPASAPYQSMYGFNIETSTKIDAVDLTFSVSAVSAVANLHRDTASKRQGKLQGYTVGMAAGYEGYNFEVGYLREHIGSYASSGADHKVFVVGVGYKVGPWTIGVQYNTADENVSKDQWQAYAVGGSYVVAKGLKVTGAAQFAENTDASAGAAWDYYMVTSAIQMSF